MPQQLKNRRIAVLAINGFEQSELVEPRDSLGKAGARWVDEKVVEDGAARAAVSAFARNLALARRGIVQAG